MSFANWLINRMTRRTPDFLIGGSEQPYIRRWWVIPRNKLFNVYLHQFLRSDEDRALHDHPWANCSILLRGSYVEHTVAAGGVSYRRGFHAGQFRLRLSGKFAHRIELLTVPGFDGQYPVDELQPCWTLFITGPRYRNWGFHCEHRWIPWEQFTAAHDYGIVGPGCDA